MVGCGKSDKKHENKDGTVNVVFEGMNNGCVQAFDELFCPKRYSKGTLAAGEVEFYKDSNGRVIHLDENKTLPAGATPMELAKEEEGE